MILVHYLWAGEGRGGWKSPNPKITGKYALAWVVKADYTRNPRLVGYTGL